MPITVCVCFFMPVYKPCVCGLGFFSSSMFLISFGEMFRVAGEGCCCLDKFQRIISAMNKWLLLTVFYANLRLPHRIIRMNVLFISHDKASASEKNMPLDKDISIQSNDPHATIMSNNHCFWLHNAHFSSIYNGVVWNICQCWDYAEKCPLMMMSWKDFSISNNFTYPYYGCNAMAGTPIKIIHQPCASLFSLRNESLLSAMTNNVKLLENGQKQICKYCGIHMPFLFMSRTTYHVFLSCVKYGTHSHNNHN